MRATGDHAKMVELICAERDDLRAEVARLREALEQAMQVCQREWLHEHHPCAMCEVARAALGRAAK